MGALTGRLHPGLPVPRRLLRLRSDAALGERFADGDEDAFAVLFERYRATVLAVSIGVLGSRDDAEDAVQDCFAALATTLRAHPPRELRPWLIRVARNAAIDVARRRRFSEYAGEGALERPAPPPTDSETLRIVLDGIRELPENQRTALLMRELAGHTYREIADDLGIDEDAVRGLIARARMGLREFRAASELPCERARQAIAVEPHHRPDDRAVRRHVRTCTGCRAYQRLLRDDANALRGLAPLSGSGLAAGGAIAGSLGAKGALVGSALTQAGAACAVSVCAVGGLALIAPRPPILSSTHPRVVHPAARLTHPRVAPRALPRPLTGQRVIPSRTVSVVPAARPTATHAALTRRLASTTIATRTPTHRDQHRTTTTTPTTTTTVTPAPVIRSHPEPGPGREPRRVPAMGSAGAPDPGSGETPPQTQPLHDHLDAAGAESPPPSSDAARGIVRPWVGPRASAS